MSLQVFDVAESGVTMKTLGLSFAVIVDEFAVIVVREFRVEFDWTSVAMVDFVVFTVEVLDETLRVGKEAWNC